MNNKNIPVWEAVVCYLLALLAVIAIIVSIGSNSANIVSNDIKSYIGANCSVNNGAIGTSAYSGYTTTFYCKSKNLSLSDVSVTYELKSDYADLGGRRTVHISYLSSTENYTIEGHAQFNFPDNPSDLFDALRINVEIISVSGNISKSM